MYDKEERKIKESRDVTYIEDKMGYIRNINDDYNMEEFDCIGTNKEIKMNQIKSRKILRKLFASGENDAGDEEIPESQDIPETSSGDNTSKRGRHVGDTQ